MNAFAFAHPMPVSAAPAPDSLTRCVVLALLLHLAVVVWVGNVDGGSAAPGRGVWGRSDSIELRLGERGGEERAAVTDPPAAPEPPRGPVGTAVQPRFGGVVREVQEDKPTPPPEPRAEPGAAQLGNWAPIQPPANVDRNLLPAATAPLAAPAAVTAPALPDLARVLAAPPPERALAAEPVLRAPVVAAPAPAIERSTPLAAPVPLPELSTPSLARPLPVPEAPPVPVPAPTPATAPTPTPTPTPPAPTPSPAPSTAPSSAAPSAAPAIISPVPGGAGRGAPDAGSRIGPDAATPPSASASAPPLNLALPKSRGGPLSAGSTPGVLSLLPRPPEKNKLANEIDKSGKADCRTAHSGAGLLAVVPLAVDALKKDGGCKW